MNIEFPLSTLVGFLLVFARVGTLVAFLPLMGIRAAPDSVRVVLAITLSWLLTPDWTGTFQTPSAGLLVVWILGEASFGLGCGVVVSVLLEMLQLAAQVAGLNAGFGYAATIDPATEADAGVLNVLFSLLASLAFFALSLDRLLIQGLALSLSTLPPATWLPTSIGWQIVSRLGTDLFQSALRVALPVVACLLVLDFAMAISSRIASQLQATSLAFPAKMLLAFALLTLVLPVALSRFAASGAVATIAWKQLSHP